MKYIVLFAALVSVSAGAAALCVNTIVDSVMESRLNEEICREESHPCPDMFFTSESVVEEYETDDAYVIVYDDADANMWECPITVDRETYELVIQAIKSKQELVGNLVLNDDYSFSGTEVYTYIPSTEFEL